MIVVLVIVLAGYDQKHQEILNIFSLISQNQGMKEDLISDKISFHYHSEKLFIHLDCTFISQIVYDGAFFFPKIGLKL